MFFKNTFEQSLVCFFNYSKLSFLSWIRIRIEKNRWILRVIRKK